MEIRKHGLTTIRVTREKRRCMYVRMYFLQERSRPVELATCVDGTIRAEGLV